LREHLSGNAKPYAGADEQSEILFLRPEFVPQDYREAASLTGRNFADLVRIAKVNGWPGYFGAPRLASAAIGAQALAEPTWRAMIFLEKLIHRIRALGRKGHQLDPAVLFGRSPFGETRALQSVDQPRRV
jgi:hypothetical protein